MMPLDLSANVAFGLISGPMRSGESSISDVAPTEISESGSLFDEEGR